ncbi:MAG: endonuclease MutS2 [Thermoleophilia bacterium]
MDPHALAVLELPAIVERLAGETATPQGESLALALRPSPDPYEVERRQALTGDAIALLDVAGEPSLAGAADVREEADHAARDGMLGPRALRDVAATIRAGLAATHALAAHADRVPRLREVVAPIEPSLGAVAEAIERSVEDDGSDLRDTASTTLRSLRRELREGRLRAAEELRRLARGGELAEHLQEDFVTERGGRPVLAVKASARGKVPGIVHDASGSGQTLFVEPFAIVELNNRLREAASAEREEAERILRDLSAQVGTRAGELASLVEAVAALDLALACGALSRRWRGVPVRVSSEVRLLQARHPLLEPATAVPIDLDLGRLRALVVSGPNTGGKTVALKTLGLAAVLHQCGLRPPAHEAALPVFDRVLADIGDEQSIEMSLSTFSGHLRNLVAILGAATERSLVLLDEVAAGTDPVEGSALAQALVARLAAQARLTIVTTHYAELKEWASATDGVANAATGFDPDTHAPLYRIALGLPGTSHALRIAERLGLDPAVVADARSRVAPERLRIAELLAEAQAAERSAADARAGADAERSAAADATRRVEEREAELAAQVEAVRRRPRASATARSPRPSATWRRRARSSTGCARRSGWRAGGSASAAARRRRRRGPPSESASATAGSGPPRSARRAPSSRSATCTSRCRSRRRSPRATRSSRPASAFAARSAGSTARRRRSSARAACGRGCRSRACGRTPPAACALARRRPRSRCARPRAQTSPTSSTCVACERRRPARRCARSSTRPRSPASARSASCTAAARAPYGPPCARSSPATRSRTGIGRTPRTARRSSR